MGAACAVDANAAAAANAVSNVMCRFFMIPFSGFVLFRRELGVELPGICLRIC
jgi:hypothetical protein